MSCYQEELDGTAYSLSNDGMEVLVLSIVEVPMKKFFLRMLEKIGLLSPLQPGPMRVSDTGGKAADPFVGPRSVFERAGGETP